MPKYLTSVFHEISWFLTVTFSTVCYCFLEKFINCQGSRFPSCGTQSKAFTISRSRALQVRRNDQWWSIFSISVRFDCSQECSALKANWNSEMRLRHWLTSRSRSGTTISNTVKRELRGLWNFLYYCLWLSLGLLVGGVSLPLLYIGIHL